MRTALKTALALTTLTVALASCGQRAATPAPTTQAPLVKVELTAPVGSKATQQGLGAQGLTGDAPDHHYDVTVRDSAGKIVTFNGTTYDPTGTGATTLTLNSANNYQRLLLLPKGTYTFENKVKDDETSATLLAYGPAAENTGTIDQTSSVVRLKFHAVYNPNTSFLTPSMSMNELYTDTKFNLALSLHTASVNARPAATVPTSDIGPVTYTLGNATDGVLNGPGSKIGVNVTARGTDTDSELNVTASFKAWVQDPGADTASFQDVTESYAQQIQTNVLTVDTVMPTLTFAPLTAATGTEVNLTGQVGDDQGISNVRAYVDGNLVASSNPAEQGSGIQSIVGSGQGAWMTRWMFAKDGDYSVVVIAEDTSGNETRVEQTVTATTPPPAQYDFTAQPYTGVQTPFTLVNGQVSTVKVNYDGRASQLHMWMQMMSCSNACGGFTVTVTDPNGQPLSGYTQGTNYTEFDPQTIPGIYTITVTSFSDGVMDFEAHTH